MIDQFLFEQFMSRTPKIMRKYFGTDGIRRIANTELTPELKKELYTYCYFNKYAIRKVITVFGLELSDIRDLIKYCTSMHVEVNNQSAKYIESVRDIFHMISNTKKATKQAGGVNPNTSKKPVRFTRKSKKSNTPGTANADTNANPSGTAKASSSKTASKKHSKKPNKKQANAYDNKLVKDLNGIFTSIKTIKDNSTPAMSFVNTSIGVTIKNDKYIAFSDEYFNNYDKYAKNKKRYRDPVKDIISRLYKHAHSIDAKANEQAKQLANTNTANAAKNNRAKAQAKKLIKNKLKHKPVVEKYVISDYMIDTINNPSSSINWITRTKLYNTLRNNKVPGGNIEYIDRVLEYLVLARDLIIQYNMGIPVDPNVLIATYKNIEYLNMRECMQYVKLVSANKVTYEMPKFSLITTLNTTELLDSDRTFAEIDEFITVPITFADMYEIHRRHKRYLQIITGLYTDFSRLRYTLSKLNNKNNAQKILQYITIEELNKLEENAELVDVINKNEATLVNNINTFYAKLFSSRELCNSLSQFDALHNLTVDKVKDLRNVNYVVPLGRYVSEYNELSRKESDIDYNYRKMYNKCYKLANSKKLAELALIKHEQEEIKNESIDVIMRIIDTMKIPFNIRLNNQNIGISDIEGNMVSNSPLYVKYGFAITHILPVHEIVTYDRYKNYVRYAISLSKEYYEQLIKALDNNLAKNDVIATIYEISEVGYDYTRKIRYAFPTDEIYVEIIRDSLYSEYVKLKLKFPVERDIIIKHAKEYGHRYIETGDYELSVNSASAKITGTMHINDEEYFTLSYNDLMFNPIKSSGTLARYPINLKNKTLNELIDKFKSAIYDNEGMLSNKKLLNLVIKALVRKIVKSNSREIAVYKYKFTGIYNTAPIIGKPEPFVKMPAIINYVDPSKNAPKSPSYSITATYTTGFTIPDLVGDTHRDVRRTAYIKSKYSTDAEFLSLYSEATVVNLPNELANANADGTASTDSIGTTNADTNGTETGNGTADVPKTTSDTQIESIRTDAKIKLIDAKSIIADTIQFKAGLIKIYATQHPRLFIDGYLNKAYIPDGYKLIIDELGYAVLENYGKMHKHAYNKASNVKDID